MDAIADPAVDLPIPHLSISSFDRLAVFTNLGILRIACTEARSVLVSITTSGLTALSIQIRITKIYDFSYS
jgi:hypothetical protein